MSFGILNVKFQSLSEFEKNEERGHKRDFVWNITASWIYSTKMEILTF